MKLCMIRVDDNVKQIAVNAWCVGGEDGVFALFPDPENANLFCEAHGDDGHWWIVGRYSYPWAKQIIEAYQEISKKTG
jgi:hypothetical protein